MLYSFISSRKGGIKALALKIYSSRHFSPEVFTEGKYGVLLIVKSWVTGGTKIRQGIPVNWRIFDSIPN